MLHDTGSINSQRFQLTRPVCQQEPYCYAKLIFFPGGRGMTIACIHCAHPRRDDQVELNSMAGYTKIKSGHRELNPGQGHGHPFLY